MHHWLKLIQMRAVTALRIIAAVSLGLLLSMIIITIKDATYRQPPAVMYNLAYNTLEVEARLRRMRDSMQRLAEHAAELEKASKMLLMFEDDE